MPAWWIQLLATVARETGWSAEYILWELPMALALGIEHAAAIYNGERMEWASGAASGTVPADMRAELEAVRARYRAPAAGDEQSLTEGGGAWRH